MHKKTLATLAFINPFVFSAADAGCFNWEELDYQGAPAVKICLDGKCVETFVAWECGNMTWAGRAYKNGIEVRCDDQVEGGRCITYSNTILLRNNSLTCKNLDEKRGCGSLVHSGD
jgi:hypothetical protein